MGEIIRFDKFAMDAIAECLENAASDILLTEINWPEQQDDTATTAIDLQVESARLWTEAVVDRMEVCAKRARRIAKALERQAARRLT